MGKGQESKKLKLKLVMLEEGWGEMHRALKDRCLPGHGAMPELSLFFFFFFLFREQMSFPGKVLLEKGNHVFLIMHI